MGYGIHNDPLTEQIIAAAIAVHRALGPGLLESAYEQCLGLELSAIGLSYQRQVNVPIQYRGATIENAYRIDLLVEGKVIVEIKAIEKLIPVHEAQLLTHLPLMNLKTGLLLNFNHPTLKEGIKRMVL
jgi:GxxExxY protein